MIISKKELIDLFEHAYDDSCQAAMLNKQVNESLADFASANQADKKAVKAAYVSYKAFKEGKISTQDDDYFTLQSIIEEHFSGNADNSEDVVSG